MWIAWGAGIAAWIVHLVVSTSLVRLSCTNQTWRLGLHGATAVCALATIAGIVACGRLYRRSTAGGTTADSDEADTDAGRVRFIAASGALLNAISLALIVVEGAYVFIIRSCA